MRFQCVTGYKKQKIYKIISVPKLIYWDFLIFETYRLDITDYYSLYINILTLFGTLLLTVFALILTII